MVGLILHSNKTERDEINAKRKGTYALTLCFNANGVLNLSMAVLERANKNIAINQFCLWSFIISVGISAKKMF